MNSILITVIPVFLLISLGFLATRFKLLDAGGVSGLHNFVFLFAIPALLFRTAMKVEIGTAAPWNLWGAFFGAAAITWVLAILISPKIPSLRPAGGAPAAITSSFGNLVMMGIPLSYAHYGEAAVVPAALIVAIHAPLHWFFATMRAEWVNQNGGSLLTTLKELFFSLAKNPIVMALVSGSVWGATGIGLHPIADRTITLLGQAGVPAALFALGLSLATYGLRGNMRGVTVLLVLKMAVFPLIAAVMAFKVFALPTLAANVVVLFACLPSGSNAYLFATRYKASIAPVSGAIGLGTFVAMFSVTAVLWMLG